MSVDHDQLLSVYFDVRIEGHPLGSFVSCEGLGCEVVIEQREEGGENRMVHQLPTRLRYPNVKVTRPVTPATADMIPRWLSGLARGMKPADGAISAFSPGGDRKPLVTWNLTAVVPVRWTGPQFTAESPKVATETLELAHHGFLGPGWGG